MGYNQDCPICLESIKTTNHLQLVCGHDLCIECYNLLQERYFNNSIYKTRLGVDENILNYSLTFTFQCPLCRYSSIRNYKWFFLLKIFGLKVSELFSKTVFIIELFNDDYFINPYGY